MNLQQFIEQDLRISIKDKVETRHLKLIVGELQRSVKKELTNDEVIAVLRSLVKFEKENLARINLESSEYLETLTKYLPKQASEEEIETWIRDNIDFSTLKVKFQAIKQVIAHFGARVNGSVVKNILINKF